ncbi:chromate efflux transporter [Thalassotalea sp. 1_MG-2023]|uniref:chromate efflux transporter n=1 Tax=Thalassotalea sp. 1_MG-2023 TaxID=3062680 RepID=UPI0026E225EC|nr:chromate efflux transporter [Thalassotalea sp. 1_MG-2023]MDO6425949.1 chromate efflux transporter [Thalassotalea sp. 1_MG-2023]
MWQIFRSFLMLGCLSFGGPVAHIGYFHRTFVDEKKWLTEQAYSNIVALSQILPGPGSSQVCFAIGYQRAGIFGAILAFLAFTLPSFLLMWLFATTYSSYSKHPYLTTLMTTFKLLAVVVVTDAVYTMFTQFCKTKATQTICLVTTISLLLFSVSMSHLLVLTLFALIGARYLSSESLNKAEVIDNSRPKNYYWLIVFISVFLLSLLAYTQPLLSLFTRYFQVGSLVFGGGHVVLPLLQTATNDVVHNDIFMAGYAAAQGVPGPMFTFASYLGAIEFSSAPFIGALTATLAIFLPGFLLMIAFLPNWQRLAAHKKVAGAIIAINAAVVGLLISALYQPLFVCAVNSATDFAWVVVGILLLKVLKWSILRLLFLALVGALFTTYF